jgi:hypothetical protein
VQEKTNKPAPISEKCSQTPPVVFCFFPGLVVLPFLVLTCFLFPEVDAGVGAGVANEEVAWLPSSTNTTVFGATVPELLISESSSSNPGPLDLGEEAWAKLLEVEWAEQEPLEGIRFFF